MSATSRASSSSHVAAIARPSKMRAWVLNDVGVGEEEGLLICASAISATELVKCLKVCKLMSSAKGRRQKEPGG